MEPLAAEPTPAESVDRLVGALQQADFAPAFRGIDPRQVHDFLGRVRGELEMLADEMRAHSARQVPSVQLQQVTARHIELLLEIQELTASKFELEAALTEVRGERDALEREAGERRNEAMRATRMPTASPATPSLILPTGRPRGPAPEVRPDRQADSASSPPTP